MMEVHGINDEICSVNVFAEYNCFFRRYVEYFSDMFPDLLLYNPLVKQQDVNCTDYPI